MSFDLSFLATQHFSSNGPSAAKELLAGLSVVLALVSDDEHVGRLIIFLEGFAVCEQD